MLLAAYNVFHLHASDSTMVDNTISAYYSNKISVIQTEFQPFLDGLSIDECWQKAKKFTFCSDNTDQKIYLQICRNEKMLFLKIEYSIDDYRDSYQNWHWNPVIQAYEPGSEFEETLSIALQDENSQISDIWCWRAARAAGTPTQNPNCCSIAGRGSARRSPNWRRSSGSGTA
jgi:hypothetical protein